VNPVPGDFDRFVESLFARHADTVYRYCRVRLGSEDAADAVSEVFIVAVRRAGEIPEREVAWLLGVARRVVANQLRSRRRHAALTDRLAGAGPAAEPDHGALIERSDVAARALRSLRPKDRDVIVLMMTRSLSAEELGTALGCTAGAASVRLNRARARLAKAVDAESGATAPPSLSTSTPGRPWAADKE
jgi:RNA polymerase sigma-70 factor (ECF subfamily)